MLAERFQRKAVQVEKDNAIKKMIDEEKKFMTEKHQKEIDDLKRAHKQQVKEVLLDRNSNMNKNSALEKNVVDKERDIFT